MTRALLAAAALAVLALAVGSADGGLPREARSQATVVSSGTGTLKGTFSFDFDTGVQTSSGADVFWRQKTSVERQLEPQNGAKLANIGVVNFDTYAPEQLQGLPYGSNPINGSNNSSNQLVAGDVFAVRTSSGNLAKVKVVTYGYDLQLQWVTYKAYKLDAQKSGSGGGRVKTSPGGIDCGSSCVSYFLAGATVTVTANPDEGSALTKWEFSCSGSGSCSIPMNNNRSVKATFDRVPVKLTVTKAGPGTVTASPGGVACGSTCAADYLWGTSVTLTAAPDGGAAFLGWGGPCSGTAPTCTTTLKGATEVKATFGALRIAAVAFDVAWKLSRVAGALRISGVADPAAQLVVTLTPKRAGAKAILKRRVTGKGTFTSKLVLPKKLLPGRYDVLVEPTVSGVALPALRRTVGLAPPKEGVVALAWISVTPKGKPVKEVPKGTKKLYAHFRFADGGRAKRKLTVEWYGPKGTLVGATGKPNRALVETFVGYKPGLFRGTWGCILRAGGVAVEDVFIRVT